MRRELDGTATYREQIQVKDDFIREEIIIFNECRGVNGRIAYLYRSRETGLWTAYGFSAYRTSEMARKNGLRTVEGFSIKFHADNITGLIPVLYSNRLFARKAMNECIYRLSGCNIRYACINRIEINY